MDKKLFSAQNGTYIDRRGEHNSRGPILRERFSRRMKDYLREQVSDSVQKRDIKDFADGLDVKIPKRDLQQPHYRPVGGTHKGVHPGNDKWHAGDKVPHPKQGGGKGGKKASKDGGGEDDFVFMHLSEDEVLDIFFEDLELPNLTKMNIDLVHETLKRRGGVATSGNPSALHVFRTKKQSIMRKVAARGVLNEAIAECERELADVIAAHGALHPRARELAEKLEKLKSRHPVALDTVDLRFKSLIDVPKPSAKAVMFCLMDVSGSMTEKDKEIAKRFYILLYLFLRRAYGKDAVKIEFIRHHTRAVRCDEHEFFYSKETGGTIVSSGLELVSEIIQAEYAGDAWNAYVCQASDGDNWNDDTEVCEQIMEEELLPLLQYFAYIEIAENPQDLWASYVDLQYDHSEMFGMARVMDYPDIYPAFRSLFKRHNLIEK
ncbi:hypothetical protein A3C87_00770 [Candidatus Kaiserbacteria bacterium RIFCSPHIGHO2_02_FULL_49_34]|uniref:Uncharacterized protein n=1 Tax=Candidatus Kaiserbacteria bacterium RIFCSPHIGHO2_02_FULL_49_34 TaxID=1798491 RepID=A0A1F6DKH4_9BACT|nr:MAG: hypothetical protein A3C87_00770 [Candidatus Kaiserbacteria bacterium RIFCSPHIGHO2_02_FULL_49_34]